MNFLSTPKFKLVADRVAESAREAALLWFVFSALDALISGRLTSTWFSANSIGSLLVWSTGMYLELVVKEKS
ncbi:MAG TPA: hypothetical protein VGA84_01620 [Thermoanaerobaculia bacterium]